MKLWKVHVLLETEMVILAEDRHDAIRIAEVNAEDALYDEEISCLPEEISHDVVLPDYTESMLVYCEDKRGVPLEKAREAVREAQREAEARVLFLSRQQSLFKAEGDKGDA